MSWLKQFNPFYSDIEINHNHLRAYPINDLIPELIDFVEEESVVELPSSLLHPPDSVQEVGQHRQSAVDWCLFRAPGKLSADFWI